jgi:ATP-dependent DNA helicase RecQ
LRVGVGHDFRPSYLRLAEAIERLNRPAGLTATASPVVRREIIEHLRLLDPKVIATGFDRPNLRLEAEHFVDNAEQRHAVVAAVSEFDGPGLLYTATRKDAEFYAAELRDRGVSSAPYHAGLKPTERDEVHADSWTATTTSVTATSAFGMGIDKPNVRFVVHASVSDSLDSYYQQIGRGGRDGQPALARLF